MNKIFEKLKAINWKSKKAIICYIVAGAVLISGTGLGIALNNQKPASSNSIVADKDNIKEKFNPKDYYKYIKGIKDLTVQKGTKIDYLQFIEYDKEYIKSIKADDSKVDINKVGKYNLLYKITTKDNNEFGITVKVKVMDEDKIKEEIKKGNEVVTDKGVQNQKETVTLDKNDVINVSNPSDNKNNSNNNDKPSNGGNNDKPSKPDNGNNNGGNNSNNGNGGNNKPTEPDKPKPPSHTHSWEEQYEFINHPAEYEDKWVVDKPAWTEEVPIYDYQMFTICNACDWVVASPDKPYNEAETTAHMKEHAMNGENGGWHNEMREILIRVDKIEHPEEGHNEKVLIKDAWTEKRFIGYKCSCGATK